MTPHNQTLQTPENTPTSTTSPHVAPTSPHAGGRPQISTSPLAPLPVGGEVELEPEGTHPNHLDLDPTPGATSNHIMQPTHTETT